MALELLPFELSQDFLVPFMFTLAVVFGIIEISNVFKGNKAVGAIISIAIAIFAASYQPFISTLNQYLPSMIWFFIVMFFIAFGLELFGLRKQNADASESMIVGGAVLTILMVIGFNIFIDTGIDLPIVGGGENLIFLVGIILIMVLFWGVLKVGGGKQDEPQQGQGR